MDDKKEIKDKAVISYIGLENQEIEIIKILCNSEIRLNEKFILKPLESEKKVDLIFINGDCKQSIQYWNIISNNYIGSLPILLCTEPTNLNNYHSMQKPLKFKGLMRTLNLLTSTSVNEEDDIDMNTARILVVDDSFLARQFMKFKLEEIIPSPMNIKLEFADNGEKALKIIKSIPVDLVFLDIRMPGKDGYEICTSIKEYSLAQIAILTGLEQDIDRRKGNRAGCDYYLSKPPKDDELLQVVESTFEWRNKDNNLLIG